MNFGSFSDALIREGWGSEALDFPDWTDVDGTTYEAASYDIHSAEEQEHRKWGMHIFTRMAIASEECDDDQDEQHEILDRLFIAYCNELASVGVSPRLFLEINREVRSSLERRGCWAGIDEDLWTEVHAVAAFLERDALQGYVPQWSRAKSVLERPRL